MYPSLYEINSRPWIKQFGQGTTLATIPDEYWLSIKSLGMDYIWLMGVWETTTDSIAAHCFHPDLVRNYDTITELWTRTDITGSPYAIEDYEVSNLLGTEQDLMVLKIQLHRLGLKLILDFVPNHFNAHSGLVEKYPEIFVSSEQPEEALDKSIFFQKAKKWFAHGRDPYFPAWSDTIQINYFTTAAHNFMTNRLLKISRLCDGVRCDMAMLILPDIFERTWGFLNQQTEVETDFWSTAIECIRKHLPGFLFIAEAYWDTQWRLQQLGFDYTYDKKVVDLLRDDQIHELKLHLSGSLEYQNRCLRFIENHDEERSLHALGDEKAKVGAILFTTIPGLRLHYDGQWQGERKRYPVQMGTYYAPDPCPCCIKLTCNTFATSCPCIKAHYDQLLKVVSHPIFKTGSWQMLEAGNNHILVFWWQKGGDNRLVIINLGNTPEETQCDLPNDSWTGDLIDLLGEDKNPPYVRRNERGIRITLPAYKGYILSPAT